MVPFGKKEVPRGGAQGWEAKELAICDWAAMLRCAFVTAVMSSLVEGFLFGFE